MTGVGMHYTRALRAGAKQAGPAPVNPTLPHTLSSSKLHVLRSGLGFRVG